MKVYIVIELGAKQPRIVGVYKSRKAAETVTCEDSSVWRNVVEKIVEG